MMEGGKASKLMPMPTRIQIGKIYNYWNLDYDNEIKRITVNRKKTERNPPEEIA